jgi:hypothetical protein
MRRKSSVANKSLPPSKFALTLGVGQNHGFCWPLESLNGDIPDLDERVDPGERVPDGEDRIDGSLAHASTRRVSTDWKPLLVVVRAINRGGRYLAAFQGFPTAKEAVVSIWALPRDGWDPAQAKVADVAITRTERRIDKAIDVLLCYCAGAQAELATES